MNFLYYFNELKEKESCLDEHEKKQLTKQINLKQKTHVLIKTHMVFLMDAYFQ